MSPWYLLFFAIAFGSLGANDVDANGWPIVRFQNGTVGVQNDGGEVHVRADVMKLHTNVLMLNDIDLIPLSVWPLEETGYNIMARTFFACVWSIGVEGIVIFLRVRRHLRRRHLRRRRM